MHYFLIIAYFLIVVCISPDYLHSADNKALGYIMLTIKKKKVISNCTEWKTYSCSSTECTFLGCFLPLAVLWNIIMHLSREFAILLLFGCLLLFLLCNLLLTYIPIHHCILPLLHVSKKNPNQHALKFAGLPPKCFYKIGLKDKLRTLH